MKPYRKRALILLATVVAVVGGYATSTRLASPASSARADSYGVWIALLKGFKGDVYYVGNDGTHSYFRAGRIFWTYYKIPVCAARPPEAFSIGTGKPYVVRLHVRSDNTIQTDRACAQDQGYELGNLDRA
jgi:hypothetical protein